MKKNKFPSVRRKISAGHLVWIGTLRMTAETNGLFPSSKIDEGRSLFSRQHKASVEELRYNLPQKGLRRGGRGENRFPAEKCVQVTTQRKDRTNFPDAFLLQPSCLPSFGIFRSLFGLMKLSVSFPLSRTDGPLYVCGKWCSSDNGTCCFTTSSAERHKVFLTTAANGEFPLFHTENNVRGSVLYFTYRVNINL